jgi:diaminohydroxyphosphoribosylaminopyrimidine deaminase/5-amino-6-(5-phosphoribosylamino)uracil reductase
VVSARTVAAIRALFPDDEEAVSRAIDTIPEGERVRLAALRVSGGSRAKLDEAIALAKLDWRDLLVEAGFADDVDAHERWIPFSHERAMKAAIAEAERARGSTGDNPWVGCVIVAEGVIVARGHTQGPGEDHAEIGALHEARANKADLARATLYSTLEPCSFHGRTPACAKVIAESGVPRLVTGIRDPNPRVDGAGVEIVSAAGLHVIEGVCSDEIRRQLGSWIVRYHPHEPLARARRMLGIVRTSRDEPEIAALLAQIYAIDPDEARAIARRALE